MSKCILRLCLATSTPRSSPNTRLSDDYSVLALAAPEIAGLARPGQFVMVKPSNGHRPAAAPAVLHLRNPARRRTARRPASRSSTSASASARACSTTRNRAIASRCLGPLGRPFEPVEPPAQAWMVAGGVGLAPFLRWREALAARGHADDALLRRARARDLYYVELLRARSACASCSPPKTAAAARSGFITAPLERRARGAARRARPSSSTCADRRR